MEIDFTLTNHLAPNWHVIFRKLNGHDISNQIRRSQSVLMIGPPNILHLCDKGSVDVVNFT